MTLLAGFKTLLLARSGRNDICVATAMANRSQLRTERVIGPLENTTLIRTELIRICHFGKRSAACATPSWRPTQGRSCLSVSCRPLSGGRRVDPASLIQVFFVLRTAPPAQAPDVAVRSFGNGLPGRTAGPADRSHLAFVDAQGGSFRHHRLMQLQERRVRAQHDPVLARGLSENLGSSGRKPREAAWAVGFGRLRRSSAPLTPLTASLNWRPTFIPLRLGVSGAQRVTGLSHDLP